MAGGVTVRRARPDEAEAVHGVLRAAFTPFRARYSPGCFDATVLDAARVRARMEEGPVFVAETEGRIVGTVGVRLDDRGAYVRGLAVHPDARRAGVGRALMDACTAWARGRTDRIWLSTTVFLAGSIALYQRLGFQDAPGPAALEGTPLRSFEKRL